MRRGEEKRGIYILGGRKLKSWMHKKKTAEDREVVGGVGEAVISGRRRGKEGEEVIRRQGQISGWEERGTN